MLIKKDCNCSTFGDWAIEKGINIPKSKWDSVKAGDIVLFDFNSNGTSDHVGIVTKIINSTTIETIEGNTSLASDDNGGCVMKRTRYKSQINYFVRPPYTKDITPETIIAKATTELGTKENPSGSNNVKYNTWYYGKEVSGNGYAWCMVFVSWLFEFAEPKSYSGTLPDITVKTTTRKMTHASTSGVEKVKGGKAGDQTGKEVRTVAFRYSPKISNHCHWTYVARPKSATVAKKIAQAMVDCANNDNIGYDQSQRLTLYTQAKKVGWVIKDIKTKCETDCSATVRVALKVAGIDVPSTFRTKNMTTNLKKTGKFTIYKYSSVKNNLKVGDILYYPHRHTAVITSVTTKTETKALEKGDTRKTEVKRLQEFLKWLGYNVGTIDEVFGDKTLKAVKQYQKDYGLTIDGKFGAKSLAKAKEIKK